MTTPLPARRLGASHGTVRGADTTLPWEATASSHEPPRPVPVLLVEDSAADATLARLALADNPALGGLHVVRTGEEALRFLRHQGEHRDAPAPALVLLDLNLPGLDGRAVLAAIRGDAALQAIPVVVLTSSTDPGDVAAAYHGGANCYVTKPVGLDQYLTTLRTVGEYWLMVATLPL